MYQGGAIPYEIERKYLIEPPREAMLLSRPGCERLRLTQTYLEAAPGEAARVRKSVAEDGGCVYTHTVKRRVSDQRRVERERELTEEEYLRLLEEADPALRVIHKTRYRIPFAGHTLEIDVYPFWSDRAILEIELADEGELPALPDWLTVLREVTGDERYTNRALAEPNGEKAALEI